ncbi:MAG: hypothetical protein LC804_13640 [Acidobacteria bacterium]|nr:hypothetical protein [Acidobacteriota bacterium]
MPGGEHLEAAVGYVGDLGGQGGKPPPGGALAGVDQIDRCPARTRLDDDAGNAGARESPFEQHGVQPRRRGIAWHAWRGHGDTGGGDQERQRDDRASGHWAEW